MPLKFSMILLELILDFAEYYVSYALLAKDIPDHLRRSALQSLDQQGIARLNDVLSYFKKTP